MFIIDTLQYYTDLFLELLEKYTIKILRFIFLFWDKSTMMKRASYVKRKMQPKNQPYYNDINIINIIFIITSLITLLLLCYFVTQTCDIIDSDILSVRIQQYMKCEHFIILLLSMFIISISYIMGGIIRLVGMIGYVIISLSITLKKNNQILLKQNIKHIKNELKMFMNEFIQILIINNPVPKIKNKGTQIIDNAVDNIEIKY